MQRNEWSHRKDPSQTLEQDALQPDWLSRKRDATHLFVITPTAIRDRAAAKPDAFQNSSAKAARNAKLLKGYRRKKLAKK